MAKTVNIHEAKTQLSKLLAKVESGEEIIIARSGKPIARLCALASNKKQPKRKPGFAKGLLPDSVVPRSFSIRLWTKRLNRFFIQTRSLSALRLGGRTSQPLPVGTERL